MIKKILIFDGNIFYWTKGDLHTDLGMVKEADILKKKKVVSNTGNKFYVLDARFIDKIQRIKRAPQVILEKDIGIILVNISLDKDSKVLEAGTGSGKMSAFLARAIPEGTLYSYEFRKEFLDIAKKNFEDLEIKNIMLKHKDVYKGISEKGLDAIVLDLPEPWKALNHAERSLKNGCYLVAYLPTIYQVMQFVNNVNKNKNFIFVKTIELIERPWFVDGKKVRPMSNIIGHTAFITFIRKI
ncbi:methyltransferase domain-containing protein [Candidatus Woesearchaeota archaeon]|nr:methyltransferase domain-containing protein [Candidatus Woesearchaeota archaeon]